MGVEYNTYLDGANIYGCKNCRTHLAVSDDIISKNFRGRFGDAYLFDRVVNVVHGKLEERTMMTGDYTVQDISCKHCSRNVGWTYVKALEKTEEYKEGKYILETKTLTLVQ